MRGPERADFHLSLSSYLCDDKARMFQNPKDVGYFSETLRPCLASKLTFNMPPTKYFRERAEAGLKPSVLAYQKELNAIASQRSPRSFILWQIKYYTGITVHI